MAPELSLLFLLVIIFATVYYAYDHWQKDSRPARDHSCLLPVVLLTIVAFCYLLQIAVWLAWALVTSYGLRRGKVCRPAFFSVRACAGAYYSYQGEHREDDTISVLVGYFLLMIILIWVFVYVCRLSALLPNNSPAVGAEQQKQNNVSSTHASYCKAMRSVCHSMVYAGCDGSTSAVAANAHNTFLPRFDRLENIVNQILSRLNEDTPSAIPSTISSASTQRNDSNAENGALRQQICEMSAQITDLVRIQKQTKDEITNLRADLDFRDFDLNENYQALRKLEPKLNKLEEAFGKQQGRRSNIAPGQYRSGSPAFRTRQGPSGHLISARDVKDAQLVQPAPTPIPSTTPTAEPAIRSTSTYEIPVRISPAPPKTRPASTEPTSIDEAITSPHAEMRKLRDEKDTSLAAPAPAKAPLPLNESVSTDKPIFAADEENEDLRYQNEVSVEGPAPPTTEIGPPHIEPINQTMSSRTEEIHPLEAEDDSLPTMAVLSLGSAVFCPSSSGEGTISTSPAVERDLPRKPDVSSEAPVLTLPAVGSSSPAENQYEISRLPSGMSQDDRSLKSPENTAVDTKTVADQQNRHVTPIERKSGQEIERGAVQQYISPVPPSGLPQLIYIASGPSQGLEVRLPVPLDPYRDQDDSEQPGVEPTSELPSDVDMEYGENREPREQQEDEQMSDIGLDDFYDHGDDAVKMQLEDAPKLGRYEMDVDNAPYRGSSRADPMDTTPDPSPNSASGFLQPVVPMDQLNLLPSHAEMVRLHVNTMQASRTTSAVEDADMQEAPQTPTSEELGPAISQLVAHLWPEIAPDSVNVQNNGRSTSEHPVSLQHSSASGERVVDEINPQADAVQAVQIPGLSSLTQQKLDSTGLSTTNNVKAAFNRAPESTSSDSLALDEDESLPPAPDDDPLGLAEGLDLQFAHMVAWVDRIDDYRYEWVQNGPCVDQVVELVLRRLAEWAQLYYNDHDRSFFDLLRFLERPDTRTDYHDQNQDKVKMIDLEVMLKQLYDCMGTHDINEEEISIRSLVSKVVNFFSRSKRFEHRFDNLPKYNQTIRASLAISCDEEGGHNPYSADEEVLVNIKQVRKMMEAKPEKFAQAVHDDSTVAGFEQMLRELERATDGVHGYGERNDNNIIVHLTVQKLLKCLTDHPVEYPAVNPNSPAHSASPEHFPRTVVSNNLFTSTGAAQSPYQTDNATTPRSPVQYQARSESGKDSSDVSSDAAQTPPTKVDSSENPTAKARSAVDPLPSTNKGKGGGSDWPAATNRTEIEVIYGEADAALGEMDRRAAGSYLVPVTRLDQTRGARHAPTGTEFAVLHKRDPLPRNSPRFQPRHKNQLLRAPAAPLRDRSEDTKARLQTQITILTQYCKDLTSRAERAQIGRGHTKAMDGYRAGEATKRLINIFKIWDQNRADVKRILRAAPNAFEKVSEIGTIIQDTPDESIDFSILKEEIHNLAVRVTECRSQLRDEDLTAEEARIRANPDEMEMGPISRRVADPAGDRYVDTESDIKRLEYLTETCAILTNFRVRAEELGYLPFDSAVDKGLVLKVRKELKEVWLNFRESGRWNALAKPGGIVRFYMETDLVELCEWVQRRAVVQLKTDPRCHVDAKTVEDLREAAVGILMQHLEAQRA